MIGFDIGGTKCAVCVGYEQDGNLTITDKRVFPTDHTVSAYEMLDRLCDAAKEMTDDFSKMGVSCGGPLDSKRGIVQSPPNLPGWDDIRVVEHLEKRLGGRAALQNDANACALAEWRYGAGKGTENMIFLTFGSGLGAGLILNGQLYSGTSDMAGEVGHIRMAPFGPVGYGKAGSMEGFCSGNGIAQLGQTAAREAFQKGEPVTFCDSPAALSSITAKDIAIAAEKGDTLAASVYETSGKLLGQGLSVLIDILNPEAIVIGSVYARSEELLAPAMQQVIAAEALPHAARVCKVLPAALGEQIGDYAALSVAAGII